MPELVIWTALPNGTVGDEAERRLRVSVLVSPRLSTEDGLDGTLQQFPDFRNWATTMAATTFDVEVDGAVVSEGIAPQNQLDDGLWSSLFHDDTLVRSHDAGRVTRPIHSYPVRPLLRDLQRLYGNMAVDARDGLPAISGGKKGRAGDLRGALAGTEFQPDPDDDGGRRPLTRFRRFHERGPGRPTAPLPESDEERRRLLDFHQAVSSLGDYPRLLRLLGLVFDLELPAGAVAAIGDSRRLRVLPRWDPADTTSPAPNRSPSTQTVWDGSRFASVPADPEIDDGLLVIDGGRYDLVQVDLDGAVHQLLNLVLNLAHAQTLQAPDSPHKTGLPVLRSAGISLVQAGRAGLLKQRLSEAGAHNTAIEGDHPEQAVFTAEQLVRGFRIDVRDSRSEEWRSLCRRVGTYHFMDSGRKEELTDEGFVQLSAAGVPNAPSTPARPDLYLHESMLRWAGWSLVAPRPGKSLDRRPDPGFGPVEPDNAPVTQFKLKTSFAPPPGSLPSLRFGADYRMRARVVDLAGNSLTVEEAGDDHAAPDGRGRAYLRYDVVPPPVIVLRRKQTRSDAPGESLQRLVIRTRNDDPGLDATPTTETTDRHVAPPRTTVDMAEAHGALDDPAGRIRKEPAVHAMLAQRDGAQLRKEDETPVEPADQLVIPYLPDVLARGAALRNLPGAPAGTVGLPGPAGELQYQPPPVVVRPDSVTQVDFGPPAGWPRMLPLRLLVVEGSGRPSWDPARRLLTVQLAKAEVATVALSSYVDRTDLDLLGIWEWLRRAIDERVADLKTPDEIAQLTGAVAEATQRAVEGGHWMLTPATDLVLVHAVQQPLGHPVVEELTADRDFDATAVALLGTMRVHGKSTAKVDLLGSWNEFVDVGPEPNKPLPAETQLAELPLRELRSESGFAEIRFGDEIVGDYRPDRDEIELSEEAHPHHEFGDTKHRVVRCRAVASTRFAEYFLRQRMVKLTQTAATTLDVEGVAPASDVVRSADGSTTYSRFDGVAGDYVVDYPAGTLARTATSGIPDGADVDVQFLPPVTRTSEDTVTVNVLSSARPAAPKVLYVVPLLEWKRQTRTNLLASESVGGWLRVYLDRPWYSSGEGELLGVLTPATGDAPELLPFASRVGADPVREGQRPILLSFPANAMVDFGLDGGGLTLEELTPSPEHRVHVHAHRVHFNADRGLWFSDIRVFTGADPFAPFVRLALARYQPDSLEVPGSDAGHHRDVKLSPVVLADFAQLPSGRSVLATYDPEEPRQLTVVVSGPTYRDTAEETRHSRVTVEVDERRPEVEGDLTWVPASDVDVDKETDDSTVADDALLWRGRVLLPEDRPVGNFRLVVKEYDTLIADDPEQPQRLLYVDALELESLGPLRVPTTTTASASPSPSMGGQTVTFTAIVTPETPGTPTGPVTFTSGATTLGTVALRNGTASLAVSDLPASSHLVVAAYRGDTRFAPSRGSVTHQVERTKTITDVVPRLEIHGKTPF